MAAVQEHPPDASHGGQQLGDVMSRAARQLQEEHGDVEATLQAVTAPAVRVVPHAEECSVSCVIGRSKIEPHAPPAIRPAR